MSESLMDYLNAFVFQDEETGKWGFNCQLFRRKGQAEKAARKHYWYIKAKYD